MAESKKTTPTSSGGGGGLLLKPTSSQTRSSSVQPSTRTSSSTAAAAAAATPSDSSNYKQFLKKAINNLNPIKKPTSSNGSSDSAAAAAQPPPVPHKSSHRASFKSIKASFSKATSSSKTTTPTTAASSKTTTTTAMKTSTNTPSTSSAATSSQQQPKVENKLILDHDDHSTKSTFEQLKSFNKQLNANSSSSNNKETLGTSKSACSSKKGSIDIDEPPSGSNSGKSSRSSSFKIKAPKLGKLLSSVGGGGGKTKADTNNTSSNTTNNNSNNISRKSLDAEAQAKTPGGKNRTKLELAAGYGFNEDQIGVFEETFQIFDKDCDGFITLVEIRTVMNALGFFPCDEAIQKSIQNIDNDNSGTVDFEEFICMMSKFRKVKTTNELDDELLEIFKIFDRNHDGFIDKEELKDVLVKLGEKITDDEVAEMIKEADIDGDNKVSFSEFRSILHDNRTFAKPT